MGAERQSIRFRTRQAGDLVVSRAAGAEADAYRLDLPAWTMEPADLPEIAALLGGLAPTEMRARDGGYRLLVYANEAQVRALRPDFPALGKLGNLLIIATAPGRETDVVSRAFAPGAARPIACSHPIGANGWGATASRPIRRARVGGISTANARASGRFLPGDAAR